jgi:polysaccharide pyruvyl transferase WcaK-like protein
VTRSFVRNVVDLARRPRQTISFGQTVPSSCRGLALELLARTLRRVACVVVRDEESRSLLAAKGVDAKLSWDIAFTTDTTSSARERAARLLANSRLRPEHTVLVSVRPFDAMYPGDQERFERQIEALAARLMARGHDVGLIIQSDVAVWDTDRAAAARIEARDPRIKVVDCLADTADPDPVATLLALMELANIVVGIRYHTTVLRLAAGRQPFNLYYSRKGADLQRRLGLAGAPIGSGLEELACEIERTADRSFDAAAIRRDVRDHFADAVRLAA